MFADLVLALGNRGFIVDRGGVWCQRLTQLRVENEETCAIGDELQALLAFLPPTRVRLEADLVARAAAKKATAS